MTDLATTAPATPTKPGYKSTEFWLSLAASLLGLAFSSGLIGAGGTAEKIAGLAASVLGALGYAVSRGMTKAAK